MLCDHNTGQGHLRSPGEKGQTKNRDLELRCMFLGQIFAKNAKNDPNTLFEVLKSVKKQIRKITVKSRNDVKSVCFRHVLCYISAIFEDIDLKFSTHIHETLPSNICYGFLKKKIIWGKLSRKGKKMGFCFNLFSKFSKF